MATIITTGVFIPVEGKCYEIHYGKITANNKTGFYVVKIKVTDASQWIDLDTGKSLDKNIAKYVVQAFREIACP